MRHNTITHQSSKRFLLIGVRSLKKYRLAAFDLDGVLTDFISSWVWVHKHFQVDNETGYELFMDHKIGDEEFMRMDIALWRRQRPGLTREEVRHILNNVPLMPGVRESFQALREKGIITAIISGGIDLLAERVGQELGADHILANGLEADEEGRLTGEGISVVPLRQKDLVLARLQQELGITRSETVAIGDTGIDIPLFRQSGLGIAFNSEKSEVLEAADVVVTRKDLRDILPHIL